MSPQITSPSATPEQPRSSTTPARRDRALGPVGSHVEARAARLLATRDTAATVATLAHLRANVGKGPGSDPTIWDVTIDGVPGIGVGDEPTPQERAVHISLTLFALHQQARTEPMHRAGVGFGLAVGRLDGARPRPDTGPGPVRRRFDAAVTSTGIDELTQHLRGLVTQLRSAGIGLDYGALADDLVQFQRPDGADHVRRRWARQLYRNEPSNRPASADPDPTETGDAEPTDSTEEHK